MLKKPRLVALAAIALVLVVAFAWLGRGSAEPTYEGRTVGEWLPVFGSFKRGDNERAVRAFKAMGTNAVPALIHYLGKRDSALRLRCYQWIQRVPLVHIHFTIGSEWRSWARDALCFSGLCKAPAAMAGALRLSHDADAGVRDDALSVLSLIAENPLEAFPAFEALQNDADPAVRAYARAAMEHFKAFSNSVHEVRGPHP